MKSQPAPQVDIPARVRCAVAAALDRKALDLRVLNLAEASDFTDYFLILSVTSQRQAQAIVSAIEERLRALKVRPLHVEGTPHGKWVLMDYGDFVVHIFDQETRQFYRLERLWADARDDTREFSE